MGGSFGHPVNNNNNNSTNNNNHNKNYNRKRFLSSRTAAIACYQRLRATIAPKVSMAQRRATDGRGSEGGMELSPSMYSDTTQSNAD